MAEQISMEIAPGERVSALVYPAAAPNAGVTLILAHGAGAGQGSDFMIRFATGLSARGIDAVTFNFSYTEQGRRIPDPNRKLESCYRAVIERSRSHARNKLAIGGKSMGGRIASQVAAADADDVSGLVFLGYPLHPPGRPEELRAKHLTRIRIPMLFVQGARDAFGTPDELRPIVQTLPLAALHVVEGGDHSFKVRKRDGVAQEVVHEAVLDRIAGWLREKLGPVGEGKIAPGR
jgi:predicted alpha/beta-hydrolase family hydrolase